MLEYNILICLEFLWEIATEILTVNAVTFFTGIPAFRKKSAAFAAAFWKSAIS